MKCTKCGADLTSEMFTCSMCFSCGCPISESEEALELEQAKIREENLQKILEQQRQYREKLKNHLLTTGFSFEGYRIENYLGIVTGETIMGTGYLSDIASAVSDVFGMEASDYSVKLRMAKQAVLNIIIKNSVDLGGNAIIGISYELMAFSGNMIGVSVTGTSVTVRKHSDNM